MERDERYDRCSSSNKENRVAAGPKFDAKQDLIVIK